MDANTAGKPAAPRATCETVLAVRHWTPDLLSFRTSRAAGFCFTPGHYARLGLGADDQALVWRPFSVVSALREQHLEFVATLVPGGGFSSLLSDIRAGHPMRVGSASYGFMTIDGLAPGQDLWLLASGSGLGPFLSILRDPATWRAYENVMLVHSVRHAVELAYSDEIAVIPDEMGLTLRERLRYLPVVTREARPGALAARIPQLIDDSRLEQAAGRNIDLQLSRIMVCGNPELAGALRAQLTARGFRTSRRGAPGQLAFENYWQSKS